MKKSFFYLAILLGRSASFSCGSPINFKMIKMGHAQVTTIRWHEAMLFSANDWKRSRMEMRMKVFPNHSWVLKRELLELLHNLGSLGNDQGISCSIRRLCSTMSVSINLILFRDECASKKSVLEGPIRKATTPRWWKILAAWTEPITNAGKRVLHQR